jgi:hypothetical protein
VPRGSCVVVRRTSKGQFPRPWRCLNSDSLSRSGGSKLITVEMPALVSPSGLRCDARIDLMKPPQSLIADRFVRRR